MFPLRWWRHCVCDKYQFIVDLHCGIPVPSMPGDPFILHPSGRRYDIASNVEQCVAGTEGSRGMGIKAGRGLAGRAG